MTTLNIKTYSINMKLTGEYFFILSKGNNAGKPLKEPCPNCFVFQVVTPDEKDFYFWLLFGLWQAKLFQQHLYGSVIPFLRISELKTTILESASKVLLQKEKFDQTITTLKNLEEYQLNIQKQLQLIKHAKVALIFKALKQ